MRVEWREVESAEIPNENGSWKGKKARIRGYEKVGSGKRI